MRSLLRRDEDPYVRLHAARALLFFCVIALAQCGLLILLLVGGAFARGLFVGAILGVCCYGYVAVEAVLAVRVWRAFLASALTGENPLLGRLGPGAALLNQWSLRAITWVSAHWGRFMVRFSPHAGYDDRAWR